MFMFKAKNIYLEQTLISRNCHLFSWTFTYFSISGAQWTKSCFQKLYVGFLMRSINVINRPQGCGLFTISLSSNTLQKKNKIIIIDDYQQYVLVYRRASYTKQNHGSNIMHKNSILTHKRVKILLQP